MSSYDPNVIVRMPDDWPDPGPFMGRDAVMRQVKQLRDTWDADTLELISDFIDVGDRVAVRMSGGPKAVARSRTLGPRTSLPCARARSSAWRSSGITPRPWKPWASSA